MQFEFLHTFLNVCDVIIILSGLFFFNRILKFKTGTSSLPKVAKMIRQKSFVRWPGL